MYSYNIIIIITQRGGWGGGGVLIAEGSYIPSDMGPGTGSHIARDMRPGGPISLEISGRGDPTK